MKATFDALKERVTKLNQEFAKALQLSRQLAKNKASIVVDGVPLSRVARRDFYRGIVHAIPGDKPGKLAKRTIDLNNGRGVAVFNVIDKSTQNDPKSLRVVLCIGINFGQGSSYLSNPPSLIEDLSTMRRLVVDAAKLDGSNAGNWRALYPMRINRFHLIASNFFPWITLNGWGSLNGIEETFALRLFGYPSVFKSVSALCRQLQPVLVVFHGVSNIVSRLGLEAIEAMGTSRPAEILFCDNLGRMVKANSARLAPRSSPVPRTGSIRN